MSIKKTWRQCFIFQSCQLIWKTLTALRNFIWYQSRMRIFLYSLRLSLYKIERGKREISDHAPIYIRPAIHSVRLSLFPSFWASTLSFQRLSPEPREKVGSFEYTAAIFFLSGKLPESGSAISIRVPSCASLHRRYLDPLCRVTRQPLWPRRRYDENKPRVTP